MRPFDRSPCRDLGLAPGDNTHPCLEPGWGDRACPLDAHGGEGLRACAARMYKLGYPYATWVVRERWFGLRRECTLQFLRERPDPRQAEGVHGPDVLRIHPASF